MKDVNPLVSIYGQKCVNFDTPKQPLALSSYFHPTLNPLPHPPHFAFFIIMFSPVTFNIDASRTYEVGCVWNPKFFLSLSAPQFRGSWWRPCFLSGWWASSSCLRGSRLSATDTALWRKMRSDLCNGGTAGDWSIERSSHSSSFCDRVWRCCQFGNGDGEGNI